MTEPFDRMAFSDEEVAGEAHQQQNGNEQSSADFSAAPTTPRDRPVIFDAGLDHAPIPPRGWLLGTTFCRKMLSSLLAGGGTGKTALRIAQALAMATGRPLTGEHVFIRSRVLFVCLEDDIDELRRRVTAARMYYGIAQADLEGWLFYTAPGRAGGKLIERTNNQLKLGWMAEWLVEEIQRLKIDAVSIDPLVKAHNAVENSNDEMDAVADVLAQIAHEDNCAVDTPHHVRKGATEAGNADQGRGAGAIKDGARLVYTLTTMTEEEAKRFSIPVAQRRLFVRMDAGKVNLVPAVDARWFELMGVRLDNRTDTYPNGDEIQVAVPWQPPETWAGLTDDMLNAALDQIQAGLPDCRFYSRASRATDTAAWRVVQQHCTDRSEPQCREIINAWFKSGLLLEEDYENPVRREVSKGLRVSGDPQKRPGWTS